MPQPVKTVRFETLAVIARQKLTSHLKSYSVNLLGVLVISAGVLLYEPLSLSAWGSLKRNGENYTPIFPCVNKKSPHFHFALENFSADTYLFVAIWAKWSRICAIRIKPVRPIGIVNHSSWRTLSGIVGGVVIYIIILFIGGMLFVQASQSFAVDFCAPC